MGREIRRVPLDFDWPEGEVWHGFLNPYTAVKCPYCKGSGYSDEADEISRSWYSGEPGRRWCENITEDEVQALLDAGRLMDLTHVWKPTEGWVPTGHVPDAAEVNAWARGEHPTVRRFVGHDSINHHICVRQRCKRLGIELLCAKCGGSGRIWQTADLKKLHDEWERIDPPSGPGWQAWETVSEGSPVTPVFESPEALAEHLSSYTTGLTYEEAMRFVQAGYAASAVIKSDGTVLGPYGGEAS